MRGSIIRLGIVSVTCLSLFGVARPVVAAPEGTVTWGVHITLASRWLDPAETEGIITPFMFLYALHDAVVKPMPGGWNTPSLAESWSQSKDGLTYEFVLRKGVKFHNGDPVTAEDVKFSYDRYRGAGEALLKDRVRRASRAASSGSTCPINGIRSPRGPTGASAWRPATRSIARRSTRRRRSGSRSRPAASSPARSSSRKRSSHPRSIPREPSNS